MRVVTCIALVALLCLAYVDGAALKPGTEEWADHELAHLGRQVEENGAGQKLGWRAYDAAGKVLDRSDPDDPLRYDGVTHTEGQMVEDPSFLAVCKSKKTKFIFIWSTQPPCVCGSQSACREACSDIVPKFAKGFGHIQFIFGYKTRQFARHEYTALAKDLGQKATFADFVTVLKAKFATAPNVLLLKYDTEKRGDNFILFTFLETGAEAVTAAKSRVLQRLMDRVAQPQAVAGPPQAPGSKKSSSAPLGSGSSAAGPDETPAHKKILLAVWDKGLSAKWDTAHVYGKDDGTLVSEVKQGNPAAGATAPAGADYLAVFYNTIKPADAPTTLNLANDNTKLKVNIIFNNSEPKIFSVKNAWDDAVSKTPLKQQNLRLFVFLGTSKLPNRLWPAKPAKAAGSTSGASAAGASTTGASKAGGSTTGASTK